ncbi:SARP family transcriptional regulator [Virgisporangium aliadipatigenens]|uniref:SARP family transcriptional regulator n=1 Tax=Virgisporangium aliadipatigenens TaxID=741659 RepID=A0A8J3YJU1_9ACTN|nr:BTAD domain-containing putative transcriptional regulator [Virgisporangium aliadipatigenens]GIJ45173.1 SARP family transcriptional regulator [Virgisporangium aliadipatigenens]
MRLALLGPLDVTDDHGVVVELPGGKPRTLLLVLACHANRPVPTEVLVESLWGPAPPRQADAALRVHVHHLRKALGDGRIGRRPEGYALRLDADELDADRFRGLVARGRAAVAAGEPERALAALDAALALWRGPVLAGAQTVPALAVDAAGLEELRLQAWELRYEAAFALGRHDGAIAGLRELADRHPLRETFREQLMRALIAGGRGAEAVAVFEDTRRVLADELGLDPDPRLRKLHLQVLRSEAAPAPVRDAPQRTVVVPRQLPARTHGFVGRREWLKRLDALLSDVDGPDDVDGGAVPIATLSGAGGIGKTTLAVYWAHGVAARFPDGQLYLNLHGFDPVRAPLAPLDALGRALSALGVPAREHPIGLEERESLYRSVTAGRRLLLVLDNAHAAAQVRPLLPGGAGCLVLVTSRDLLSGLAAAGARPFVLGPLPRTDAYDLLERRLGPERVAAEPAAVESIVARCGGLPLALSVVAARSAVLAEASLAPLAAELTGPRRALDGFSGDDAATDLRSVFSWSYRVLEPGVARMFRLLSLHPGPELTVGAAASLAGVAVEEARAVLRQLRAASLMTEPSPGRYGFHDLVRAYAVELAEGADPPAERDAALVRLLDHLLHTAYPAALLLDPHQTPTPLERAAEGVTPDAVGERAQALAWFDAETPGLLAAVERARDGFPGHAWRLAFALVVHLERGGHWTDKLAVLDAARESARRTGERGVEARALRSLGRTLGRLRRYDEAVDHLRAAAALYRDLDDPNGLAHATATLGELLERAGRVAEAMAADRAAVQLYRAAGNVLGEARSLGGVATLQTMTGEHAAAIDTCRRALDLFARLDDPNGAAGAHDTLGTAQHHLGDHEAAAASFHRALATLGDTGDRYYVALALDHLADTHAASGAGAEARRRYGEALKLFTALAAREADSVRDKLASLR